MTTSHRNWTIDRDYIGHWRAVHPKYDGESYPVQLTEPTYEALIEEIDTWIEENGE